MLDWSNAIPYLILIWAGMLVMAVLRSRSLTHSKTLLMVSWWITNATWLTIGMLLWKPIHEA